MRTVIRNSVKIERCDAKDCGDLRGSFRTKKGGFMFGGKNLHQNSNLGLAKQVRQEYQGDDSDEHRGRDF